jgi:GT2 family glycosyltransferase
VGGLELMRVAILIVAFDNCEDVKRCLRALADSTHRDFEVVICENAGAAAFSSLSAAVPGILPPEQPVRLIQAPGNGGFAAGNNICLGAASPQADAFWILNPDTQPTPTALEEMVKRLEQGDCEAVGCVLCLPQGVVQAYGGYWNKWLARTVSLGSGEPLKSTIERTEIEAKQNFIFGTSMLFSREFLRVAGELREDYFLYCEEIEWCIRAEKRGLKLGFAPAARVLHFKGTTTGNVADIRKRSKSPVYLDERNRILLTRDQYPGFLPVAAIASVLQIALRYMRRGAVRQFFYALEGWFAGLRNERGYPRL